ncbi:MAG: lipid-A-disaccharide synthase N-terminal domain-containing protein [Phycisphaerales bacterium]|jgi:lipid-A-disaccharide synthase-like uncharacterized protein
MSTPKKRIKWEPWAAMVLLLALGLWLVWSPLSSLKSPKPRAGAETTDIVMGPQKGLVEISRHEGADPTFRVLWRGGFESPEMTATQFRQTFGEGAYTSIAATAPNELFRVLHITSWWSLAWVSVGFIGQIAFMGRQLVQWMTSEKHRQSIVPPAFWWFSLVGGVMLFSYFVWRQDFVGVLGQSTGVVIYARNLRLIYKHQRRQREALAASGATSATPATQG